MAPRFQTGGGQDRMAAAIEVHGANFLDDPVLRYFFNHMAEEPRQAHVRAVISVLIHTAAAQDAVFDEAWVDDDDSGNNDHNDDNDDDHNENAMHDAGQTPPAKLPACSVVWMRPGSSTLDFAARQVFGSSGLWSLMWTSGFAGLKRVIGDYGMKVQRAKRHGLRWPDGRRITRYYYMCLASTMLAHRGQGLSSELIRRFQTQAARERLPIWTEASTHRSHRLYVRLGFRDVETCVLGKGSVDAEGYPRQDGEGVRAWALLWTPEPA